MKKKKVSPAERQRRQEAALKSDLINQMKRTTGGDQSGQLGELSRKAALNTKRTGPRYDGRLKYVHQETGREKTAHEIAKRMGILDIESTATPFSLYSERVCRNPFSPRAITGEL